MPLVARGCHFSQAVVVQISFVYALASFYFFTYMSSTFSIVSLPIAYHCLRDTNASAGTSLHALTTNIESRILPAIVMMPASFTHVETLLMGALFIPCKRMYVTSLYLSQGQFSLVKYSKHTPSPTKITIFVAQEIILRVTRT